MRAPLVALARRIDCALLCAGLLALLISVPAAADKVFLKDSRILEGRVEIKGDKVIIHKRLGTVSVTREMVLRIEYGKSPEDQFQQKFKAIDKTDPAALRKLADWCRANGVARGGQLEELARIADLRRQADKLPSGKTKPLIDLWHWAKSAGYGVKNRKFLLERVLAIEPDHSRARELMGFLKHKGQWLPAEEARKLRERDFEAKMRSQGLVRWGGKWVKPDEAKSKQYIANLFNAVEEKDREIKALKAKLAATGSAPADPKKVADLEKQLEALKTKLANERKGNTWRYKVYKQIKKADEEILRLVLENAKHYRDLEKYYKKGYSNYEQQIEALKKLIQANRNHRNSLIEKRKDLWDSID